MKQKERDELLFRLDEKMNTVLQKIDGHTAQLSEIAPKVQDHESTLKWVKLGVGGGLTALGGLIVQFIHDKMYGR